MTDWRANLNSFMGEADNIQQQGERPEFDQFISNVVIPAFDEIRSEMEQHGRIATIRTSPSAASVIVRNRGEEEIMYRIQGRIFPNGVLPFAEIRFRQRKGLKLITVESMFRSGTPDYSLSDITSQEIIENFVNNYTKRVQT
ncbi:MAG: hypothetical protein KAH23_01965 [Kiritimatiellae bacterium]|nr:hypothetical protein [Kiritimatiellia bacterium]